MQHKILVLLPFIAKDESFLEYNKKYVFPSDVDIRGLSFGRRMNESPADSAITIYEELKAIVAAEKEGYEAVIIGCFLDPGVREAREVANIPVFGVANVSLNICAMLGHRTGVITTSKYVRRGIEANLREWGMSDRVVVRDVDSDVKSLISGNDNASVVTAIVAEAIQCIEDQDVAVLTLGCGGLYGLLGEIKTELYRRGYDVPFVESHKTAVEVVKNLLDLQLMQSRATYPQLGNYEGLT